MKDQTGSALVSALVAAGISMATLMAVLTTIQYSQKSGQAAQAKSEFGALVDSVRSITASSEACKAAFVDQYSAVVRVTPPTAVADSTVEADAIRVGGVNFVRKSEKLGAFTLQAIRLTRPMGTSDLLSVQLVGQKQGEVLGVRELQTVTPIMLKASFGAGNVIESCQLGSGGNAADAKATCEVLGGTYIAAIGGAPAKCTGGIIRGRSGYFNCVCVGLSVNQPAPGCSTAISVTSGYWMAYCSGDRTGQNCYYQPSMGILNPAFYRSWNCNEVP